MKIDTRKRLNGREIRDHKTGRAYSYMKILSLTIRLIKKGSGKPSEEEYRCGPRSVYRCLTTSW